MYKQCLSYRSAFQRPGRHPNPFDEKGPVLEWFWDRNLIGMNQKPVPNCPGPGSLGSVAGPFALGFGAQNQPKTGPCLSKGLVCLYLVYLLASLVA